MIDEKAGIDFPFFQSQVVDIFGEPDENGPFARDYLRAMDFTEFAAAFGHVLDFTGHPWSHRIYGNWIMGAPLRRAFGLICDRGLAGEIVTFDGCFNIRRSRGGDIMSMHSWGLAIDFNAAANGYGQEPSMSPELVKCFAESGFEWGGLWSKPDGMHFQLPWVRFRTDGNPLNPIPWTA